MSQETQQLSPEMLLAEHGDFLFQYAKSRLRSDDAASDVVQETFLAALQKPTGYTTASNPRAWLMGILKHKIMDWFRKSQREVPMSSLSADQESDAHVESFFDAKGHWINGPRQWQGDPVALLRDKDFMRVFQACLGKLTDRLAQVFILREVEQVECDEVCKTLGITATNLYASLHRARFRLRGCIEKNWMK